MQHLQRLLQQRTRLQAEADALAMASADPAEMAKKGQLLARSASLANAVEARAAAQQVQRPAGVVWVTERVARGEWDPNGE